MKVTEGVVQWQRRRGEARQGPPRLFTRSMRPWPPRCGLVSLARATFRHCSRRRLTLYRCGTPSEARAVRLDGFERSKAEERETSHQGHQASRVDHRRAPFCRAVPLHGSRPSVTAMPIPSRAWTMRQRDSQQICRISRVSRAPLKRQPRRVARSGTTARVFCPMIGRLRHGCRGAVTGYHCMASARARECGTRQRYLWRDGRSRCGWQMIGSRRRSSAPTSSTEKKRRSSCLRHRRRRREMSGRMGGGTR